MTFALVVLAIVLATLLIATAIYVFLEHKIWSDFFDPGNERDEPWMKL